LPYRFALARRRAAGHDDIHVRLGDFTLPRTDLLVTNRFDFTKRNDPNALSAPTPTRNSKPVAEVAKASVSRESPTVVRFPAVIAEGFPPLAL
jgi:hypothetical protein